MIEVVIFLVVLIVVIGIFVYPYVTFFEFLESLGIKNITRNSKCPSCQKAGNSEFISLTRIPRTTFLNSMGMRIEIGDRRIAFKCKSCGHEYFEHDRYEKNLIGKGGQENS